MANEIRPIRVTLEDHLDLLSALANQGIYFALGLGSKVESSIWKIYSLVSLLEATGGSKPVTKVYTVTDFCREFDVPETSRSVAANFLACLQELGIVDKVNNNKEMFAYKNNLNFKVKKDDPVIVGFSTGHRMVLLRSPRMDEQQLAKVLAPKLKDYPNLLVTDQRAKYALVSQKADGAKTWIEGTTPSDFKFKAYWFLKLGVRNIPDLAVLDYPAPQFWSTVFAKWFLPTHSLTTKNQIPQWDTIAPEFWACGCTSEMRGAMINRVSPWKPQFGKPITIKEMVNKAVAEAVVSPTDVIDIPEETGVIEPVSKNEKINEKIEVTEPVSKNEKIEVTEPVSKKEDISMDNQSVIKDHVEKVVDLKVSAFVKIAMLTELVNGASKDSEEDLAAIKLISQLTKLETTDAMLLKLIRTTLSGQK